MANWIAQRGPMYTVRCGSPRKKDVAPSAFHIVEMQLAMEVYGTAPDDACVIILVLITSIGCVTSAPTNAEEMPRTRFSSTVSAAPSREAFLARRRRCIKAWLVKVATTNGTLRDAVGSQPE
eukprot:6181670-Pleurochrysis_carterae.AAC.3